LEDIVPSIFDVLGLNGVPGFSAFSREAIVSDVVKNLVNSGDKENSLKAAVMRQLPLFLRLG
jgi:hypothetical protein